MEPLVLNYKHLRNTDFNPLTPKIPYMPVPQFPLSFLYWPACLNTSRIKGHMILRSNIYCTSFDTLYSINSTG